MQLHGWRWSLMVLILKFRLWLFWHIIRLDGERCRWYLMLLHVWRWRLIVLEYLNGWRWYFVELLRYRRRLFWHIILLDGDW